MGCKNNPKLSRIPIAKARIEVAQTMTRSDERLTMFIKHSCLNISFHKAFLLVEEGPPRYTRSGQQLG